MGTNTKSKGQVVATAQQLSAGATKHFANATPVTFQAIFASPRSAAPRASSGRGDAYPLLLGDSNDHSTGLIHGAWPLWRKREPPRI